MIPSVTLLEDEAGLGQLKSVHNRVKKVQKMRGSKVFDMELKLRMQCISQERSAAVMVK